MSRQPMTRVHPDFRRGRPGPRSWHATLAATLLASIPTLLVGCASTANVQPDIVDVLHPDSTTTLPVEVGAVVGLDLPGHAGTGYAWSLNGACPAGLRFLDGPVFRPDDPGLAGSRGSSRFRFKVERAGRYTLAFDYARGWETGARPVRRSTVVLDATKD